MKGLIIEKSQLKDSLVGNRYGRLTVKELAGYVLEKKKVHGKPGHGKKAVYSCDCECGNTHLVRAKDLKRNLIRSCGCLHKETSSENGKANQKPNGQAALNEVYRKYKYGSKQRGIEFHLTIDEFRELTSMDCDYCGNPPSRDGQTMNRLLNSSYLWNGLDRVDSDKEYTLDNVVPCCKDCNYAKHTKTQQEFYDWIKRLVKHQELKQSSLEPILKIRLEQNLTNV